MEPTDVHLTKAANEVDRDASVLDGDDVKSVDECVVCDARERSHAQRTLFV